MCEICPPRGQASPGFRPTTAANHPADDPLVKRALSLISVASSASRSACRVWGWIGEPPDIGHLQISTLDEKLLLAGWTITGPSKTGLDEAWPCPRTLVYHQVTHAGDTTCAHSLRPGCSPCPAGLFLRNIAKVETPGLHLSPRFLPCTCGRGFSQSRASTYCRCRPPYTALWRRHSLACFCAKGPFALETSSKEGFVTARCSYPCDTKSLTGVDTQPPFY